MFGASGQGVRTAAGQRHLPLVAAAVALLLPWSMPAHADKGLFRCTGPQGETVFTGSRAGYHDCRRVSGLAAGGRLPPASGPAAHVADRRKADEPAHQASRAAKATPAPRWVYRQAPGDTRPAMPRVPKGSRVVRGAVYRVEHADGSIEFTNVKPRGHAPRSVKTMFTYIATCLACDVHSTLDWHTVPLNTTAYAEAIRRAAADSGVSRALLRAVIHAESAFNPRALSGKGAQGLMQLMPATAEQLNVANAFDAAQNIRGGARYLAQLLKTFHGDERLAVAAYNAGPDAVRKYGKVPPYAETRVYVKRVNILRERYAQALARGQLASARPAG